MSHNIDRYIDADVLPYRLETTTCSDML